MTRFSSAVSPAAALPLSACIVRGGQPRALYPNPEQARAPGEIARLFGPIGSVDGQDAPIRSTLEVDECRRWTPAPGESG